MLLWVTPGGLQISLILVDGLFAVILISYFKSFYVQFISDFWTVYIYLILSTYKNIYHYE